MGGGKKGFSERHCKIELVSRKLYHMVREPSLQILKVMKSQNIICDCPVTVEDIDIAENIFDPDVSTFNGRTTRQRPKLTVDGFIEITG